MTSPNVSNWIEQRYLEFLAAGGLLTRLPIPPSRYPRQTPPADGIWAFPVIGCIVGACSALAYALSQYAGLPQTLSAIACLATSALITGLLHEDGLADFADSAGGSTVENRRIIMRDSRIGTYGVSALFGSFFTRWAAITAIAPEMVIPSIVAAHCAGRAFLGLHYLSLYPARTDGLAAGSGHPSTELLAFTAFIGTALLLLLVPFEAVSIVLLVGAITGFLLAGLTMKMIGGYTGDTLGTAEQIGEIVAFVCLAAMLAS